MPFTSFGAWLSRGFGISGGDRLRRRRRHRRIPAYSGACCARPATSAALTATNCCKSRGSRSATACFCAKAVRANIPAHRRYRPAGPCARSLRRRASPPTSCAHSNSAATRAFAPSSRGRPSASPRPCGARCQQPEHVLTRMAHVYVHVHMHVHVRVHVRTSASLSLSSSH